MLRVAIGLSILVCSSLPFALLMQSVRRKFEWFNNLITWIENKLGEKMAEGLRSDCAVFDPIPVVHLRNNFLGVFVLVFKAYLSLGFTAADSGHIQYDKRMAVLWLDFFGSVDRHGFSKIGDHDACHNVPKSMS